jgi:hypothetical protein
MKPGAQGSQNNRLLPRSHANDNTRRSALSTRCIGSGAFRFGGRGLDVERGNVCRMAAQPPFDTHFPYPSQEACPLSWNSPADRGDSRKMIPTRLPW